MGKVVAGGAIGLAAAVGAFALVLRGDPRPETIVVTLDACTDTRYIY